jgi:protein transport protein SEC31
MRSAECCFEHVERFGEIQATNIFRVPLNVFCSCGKDNRTILWDLYTLQPIADIPNEEPDPAAPQNENSASSSLFSGGLGSSQQKRYDVQWSPLKRGVVSTCSFDRKVQVHSVIGLATRSGRPPKWLQPSSGVSCGFGGSVVSFSSNDKVVKIVNVAEEPKLVEASNKFEAEIGRGDTIGFCQTMASKASRKGSKSEAEVWGFMQVIFGKFYIARCGAGNVQ